MRKLKIHRLYFTKSDCYKNSKHGTPAGIQVHSTGANNAYLHRYVGPDDGLLGPNKYGNTWNQPGFNKCGNAFIGKLQNGTVAVYQTLPWEQHCWLSGSGNSGKQSANAQGFIGFEICEDNRQNRAYFEEAVMNQSVCLCAYLCLKYDIPVDKVLDHSELHKLGMATNHGDITWWLKNFGLNMEAYRMAVRKAMDDGVLVTYIEGDDTWIEGVGKLEEDIPDTGDNQMTKEKMTVTASSGKTVNLRSGPKGTYPVVTRVPIGSTVTRMTDADGWSFIQYNDVQGYMMSKYLVPATEEDVSKAEEGLSKECTEELHKKLLELRDSVEELIKMTEPPVG